VPVCRLATELNLLEVDVTDALERLVDVRLLESTEPARYRIPASAVGGHARAPNLGVDLRKRGCVW
jgi:hypothetical protein